MTNKFGALSIASIVLVPAVAAEGIQVPPAPPAVQDVQTYLPGPMLVSWAVDHLACDSGSAAFSRAPQPDVTLLYGNWTAVPAVTFTFRIDADGRALSITRQSTTYVPETDDLAPALAAARFAPGSSEARCSITFLAGGVPIPIASREDAMRFTVFPTGPIPPQVWDRARVPGATCADRALAPLMRAYPDFTTMKGTPRAARVEHGRVRCERRRAAGGASCRGRIGVCAT